MWCVRLSMTDSCWSFHIHISIELSSPPLLLSPTTTKFISQCSQSTSAFLCMHLDVLHTRLFSYTVCSPQNTFLTFIFHLANIHLFPKFISDGTFFRKPSLNPFALVYIRFCTLHLPLSEHFTFCCNFPTHFCISAGRLSVLWWRPSLVLYYI